MRGVRVVAPLCGSKPMLARESVAVHQLFPYLYLVRLLTSEAEAAPQDPSAPPRPPPRERERTHKCSAVAALTFVVQVTKARRKKGRRDGECTRVGPMAMELKRSVTVRSREDREAEREEA